MAKIVWNPFTDNLDYTGNSGGGGGGISTLTGNTGVVGPTAGNISIIGAGAITVSGNPSTSTLTITSGNPFFVWAVITASQVAVTQHGYFTNGSTKLQVQLPSTSNVGDTFSVGTINANGWQITQGTGQQILFGESMTTAGTVGNVSSADIGDLVELVCYQANTLWMIIDSIGTAIQVN
jgi:hypothetical protein